MLGFRPAPRTEAPLAGASASSIRFEIIRPTFALVVRPFAAGLHPPLLWPLLTSEDASENLSILVAQQHAFRSPRVLRTLLHAYACRIYSTLFRASTGLCVSLSAHPNMLPLSASCSSGQRFAHSFLPIPPRDGHRCRSANISPCRVCRGLSPPRACALPGAQKSAAGRGAVRRLKREHQGACPQRLGKTLQALQSNPYANALNTLKSTD